MQQHGSKYFAYRHTRDPWGGVKPFLFLKVVMLHIKLKGIEHRTLGLWIARQVAIRSDPRFMSYDSQIKPQVTG